MSFSISDHNNSKRVRVIKLNESDLDRLIFPFKKHSILSLEYKPFSRFSLAKSLDEVFQNKLSKTLSEILNDRKTGTAIVEPDIKNKKFGLGNSLMVYDGKDYYSIYYNKVTKLNKKQIKGKVIGYVSPIGNNDVPYPMMFTNTHIYSWCDDIDEYEIPNTETKKLIQMLLKYKTPFDIPKNKVKQVNDFFNKYQCHDNKPKLKQKTLVSVKY